MVTTDVLENLIVFGLFPAWLAAGFADWLCHRSSRIEQTSGARESALHVALYLEISLPVVAALFVRVNALVLVLMGLAVALHFATSLADTRYSQPRRYISPLEQQIHGLLETLPLFALVLLVLLTRTELHTPTFDLELRKPALPAAVVLATLGALALGLAFIIEEWLRCRRYTRATLIAASPGAANE